ncbi:MAG: 16S rRNA (guanine(966)-N(2))-methyltransferase RsmD [Chloroflexi bacterium RBG_16_54_18]|nr:MAG: 16S rRNA (guanine(966)-N(2))-methyltransferase RsmD [Chloroflexi bacterium RBG_16_54_18]
MPGLRVIAGSAKGRRIHSVPGDITRPITDRAKESLFNIIGPDIEGAAFLDLFAGTGSVGIEALSRGASFCRFVDKNNQALDTVKSNLKLTGFTNQAQVMRMDALKMLALPPDRKFEYAFIAPPQYKKMWLNAIQGLNQNSSWLSDDAWVIVQIHPVEYEAVKLEYLGEFEQRKYGSVLFVFFSTSS